MKSKNITNKTELNIFQRNKKLELLSDVLVPKLNS